MTNEELWTEPFGDPKKRRKKTCPQSAGGICFFLEDVLIIFFPVGSQCIQATKKNKIQNLCMMIVFRLMFRNSFNSKVQHYHLSSSLKHEDSSPETTTSLRAISWTTTSRWKTISSRGWAKPILRPRGLKQTEVPNRNCSVPFEKFERTWVIPPKTKNMEELLVDLGTLQTSGSVELAKRDGHMTAVFLWWIRWGFLFFDDFYKIYQNTYKNEAFCQGSLAAKIKTSQV